MGYQKHEIASGNKEAVKIQMDELSKQGFIIMGSIQFAFIEKFDEYFYNQLMTKWIDIEKPKPSPSPPPPPPPRTIREGAEPVPPNSMK